MCQLANPPGPEETGWKDTAKANPGEVLRIIAKFDLPDGAPNGTNIYVCHCHILEHEENDMMFYYGVRKNCDKEDDHRDDDDIETMMTNIEIAIKRKDRIFLLPIFLYFSL